MELYDGTEADAMDDSGYEVELDPDCEQAQEEREAREHALEVGRAETRGGMRARYVKATNAKTGSTIACPTCGKSMKKSTYNKVFCSNGRTRGRGRSNCKDRYWNTVDEVRSERAEAFMR